MSSPYYLLPEPTTNMHDDDMSTDTLDKRNNDEDSCDLNVEFFDYLLGEELFDDNDTNSLLLPDGIASNDPVPSIVYVVNCLRNQHTSGRSQRQADLCLRMTSCCGFVIGCAVGSLLEGALLGFLFLVETKDLQPWNTEGFIGAAVLFWCSATALIALMVCNVLRNLVMAVFAPAQKASRNVSVKKDLEQLMSKAITNVDFWYAVGNLFGMLAAWGITCAALEYGGDELVKSLTQEETEIALLSYNY